MCARCVILALPLCRVSAAGRPEGRAALHSVQEAALFPLEQPVLPDGPVPGAVPPQVNAYSRALQRSVRALLVSPCLIRILFEISSNLNVIFAKSCPITAL